MRGRALLALLVSLAPLWVAAPSGATMAYNDGETTAAGAVRQGEADSTRDGAAPAACVPQARIAVVKVRTVPVNLTDSVRAEVQFVNGRQQATLSRNLPAIQFTGTVADSCIAPVKVTGLRVAAVVAYVITDEPPPEPK